MDNSIALDNAIRGALWNGDFNKVKELLSDIIEYRDAQLPNTMLTIYAEKGYDRMVEFLSQSYITPSIEEKSLALYYAILNNHVDTALILIKEGAQNSIGPNNITPLMLAILNNFPKPIIDLLINSNININHQDQLGNSALSMSVGAKNYYATKIILEKTGRDINATNSPLILCINHEDEINKWLAGNPITEEKSAMLCKAIITHNIDIALTLINAGAQNLPGQDGMTPLMLAILHNAPHMIIDPLIESSININYQNLQGRTALFIAADTKNHYAINKLITEQKAQSMPDKEKVTPLMLCIKNGYDSLMTIKLIDRYAHLRNEEGKTALHEALLAKNTSLITALIQTSIDNVPDQNDVTPLMLSFGLENIDSLWQYWNTYPNWNNLVLNYINHQDKQGVTALHLAAYTNNIKGIFFLISHGANDIPDNMGITPSAIVKATNAIYYDNMQRWLANKQMHNKNSYHPSQYQQLYYQIMINDLKSISEFIKAGMSLDITNADGISPLMQAASCWNEEATILLLKGNFDINFQGYNGDTALSYAIKQKHFKIAQMLLDHGASPNILGYDGTPLMIAASRGYTDLVELMLSYDSCNVNIPNRTGKTALFYTFVPETNVNGDDTYDINHAQNCVKIAKMLLNAGAHIQCWSHNALLAYTKYYNIPSFHDFFGYKEVIELILQQDLDSDIINVRDNSTGRTVLHNLIDYEMYDCAEILINKGASADSYDNENGETPLMLAAKHNFQLLKLMIQKNIVKNLDVENGEGHTALTLALDIPNNDDACQMLIKSGVNLYDTYLHNDNYITALQDYQTGKIPKNDSPHYITAMLNKMYYLLRHIPPLYPNEPLDKNDEYQMFKYNVECKRLDKQHKNFYNEYQKYLPQFTQLFSTDDTHNAGLLALQVNYEIIHNYHGDFYKYFSKFHNTYRYTENKILLNQIKKLISNDNFIINSKEEIVDYLSTLQSSMIKQKIGIWHTNIVSHKRTHDEISDNESDNADDITSKYARFNINTNIIGETKFDDNTEDI